MVQSVVQPPSEKVAKSLGLSLVTDKEIVYGYDSKRYFKGDEPTHAKKECKNIQM